MLLSGPSKWGKRSGVDVPMDRSQAVSKRAVVTASRTKSKPHLPAIVQELETRCLLSVTPVIDVAVLYTPGAVGALGSQYAVTNRITRAIADTNMALANSQVNATVRLVYSGEVPYTESGSINTDLINLQQSAGALGGVNSFRNQYGADIVSLWVGPGSSDEAGRAFQPDYSNVNQSSEGFNVVQARYAVDNFVFAHEIGHNLGAGHDRGDPTPRSVPYAYGKTFYLGNYHVGDMMSDGGVERDPYYSNPNVSYLGVPTGNPDNSALPADNAHVMNDFAGVVANYRASVVADVSPPRVSLEQVTVNPTTHTLTVKIQYADDTAVSVASLGTGTILVTAPGFSRLANFQGVDFASDGAQRVATYSVDISGFSTDPNFYSFILQPNRLRDVYNHVSSPGVLGAPGAALPDRAGPRLISAFDAGAINGTSNKFINFIDSNDPTAFYRFTLTSTQIVTANLTGLSGNVDELLVRDQNSDGQIQSSDILAYPRRPGTSPETINMTLAAGTYYLWVAPPTLGIASSYTLTLSAASSNPSTTTPPTPPTVPNGSISGVVFNDLNANGVRDAGDFGLSGWLVYADLNNNNRLDPGEAATFTDKSGAYRLGSLAAGNYIIRAAHQITWRQTTPVNNWGIHVTLAPGQSVFNANTGETQKA
jgi:reprolysin-like metallo-peptidase family M12B/SdrD B-like protein/pre-peptidase